MAAHELTVSNLLYDAVDFCLYQTLNSTRLTLPAASTIKKASSNNGGPMLLARASKSDRIASSNNIPVINLAVRRSHSELTLISEYTVDDGKGGKVHVNVRIITFILVIRC